ncbi:MAG: hypothetical protein FWE21_10320 [Defluviitaleaceae bacterium]|nr:hypothetical protein [Defluviitaleaceae bacterium]
MVNVKQLKRDIQQAARAALVKTAVDLRDDLVQSGTMPFESGRLQNAATYVDVGGLRAGRAAVVSDMVYARRKYFHPEFNFDRSINRNAGGRWFDAYVTGGKRGFAPRRFKENWGR